MIKKKDAPKPKKYLGHGQCDNLTKSSKLLTSTNSFDILHDTIIQLYRQCHVNATLIRGFNLMAKLDISSQSESVSEEYLGGNSLNLTKKSNDCKTSNDLLKYFNCNSSCTTMNNPNNHEFHVNPSQNSTPFINNVVNENSSGYEHKSQQALLKECFQSGFCNLEKLFYVYTKNPSIQFEINQQLEYNGYLPFK